MLFYKVECVFLRLAAKPLLCPWDISDKLELKLKQNLNLTFELKAGIMYT